MTATTLLNVNTCPICGGLVIWDYDRGEIVCSSCGVVHDYIIGFSDFKDVKWRRKIEQKAVILDRKSKYRKKSLRRIERKYRELEKLERRMLYKISVKLFSGNARSIISIASIKAIRNVYRYNLRETIEKGIRLLESANPSLLARSIRGLYALAYMLAVYSETGEMPPLRFIMDVFKVSCLTYYKNKLIVLKLVEKK